MKIIGCDFHTRYQQIAMMDEATGELTQRRLEHLDGEARTFYRNLPQPVRVGIEATGPMHWFERLLAELGQDVVKTGTQVAPNAWVKTMQIGSETVQVKAVVNSSGVLRTVYMPGDRRCRS